VTLVQTRGLPDYLVVGHVAKPHGTRGELLVQPLTDHPGDVFAPGVVLRPADAAGSEPDSDLPPLRIDGVRPFQRGWLVSFGGVEDRDAADLLRGRYLLIERTRLPELAEGEVFLHQLLGLAVETAAGARIGEVTEVYEVRPADLLEVRTEKGTVLIPFVASIVREVDVGGGRILIDPPEGLLE
jgi:16S rRNA processing protein RimM